MTTFAAAIAAVLLGGAGTAPLLDTHFLARATCTGAADCKACSTCENCAHCSQAGKSCGVCRDKPASRPTTQPTTRPATQPATRPASPPPSPPAAGRIP